MSDKITRGGTVITTREFEVTWINSDGDAIDVRFFQTKRLALARARFSHTNGDVPFAEAIAVEEHINKQPMHLFDKPDVYKTILTLGNQDALEKAGWEV